MVGARLLLPADGVSMIGRHRRCALPRPGIRLIWLGSGAAEGVPVPGCRCTSCAYARHEPRARRLPSGVLVASGEHRVLLDCGPGVPQSAWWDCDRPVTATCITHLHADHCLGLASLRWSPQVRPIPVYIPAEIQATGNSFDHGTGLPHPLLRLAPVALRPFDTVRLADGLAITAVPLRHDGMPTLGWVVQAGEATVAYLVDTKGLPWETWEYMGAMARLDCVIIDATCRPGHHSAGHHDVDEALDLGARLGAGTVVLSHIAHHNWPQPRLERYVAAQGAHHPGQQIMCAYDGMRLDVVHAPAIGLESPLAG